MNENEIMRILGLDHADISSIEVYHDNGVLTADITLNPKEHICPICSSPTSKIKGYQTKIIKHSVLRNIAFIIHYRARRYICPICKKSFYENNPFAYKGSTISLATVSNVLEDLKNPSVTFAYIAEKYNISPSSAALIFDNHVDIPRRQLSECMAFDETYCFKSKDSNYICVLLDHSSKNIIDILPSRRKADLSDYFFKIPLEERKKVKYVSFDMWETYRIISKQYFPKAYLIVDKFHILQELTRKVTRVRISVMNRYKKLYDEIHDESLTLKNKKQKLSSDRIELMQEADKNYYLLKKFEWLLFTSRKLDPNDEKKMNHKLGRYLNLSDIYDMIINIDDGLKEAVDLKERVSNFYKKETFESAKKELEDIIIQFRTANTKEMNAFADTLVRWKNEIINSFIIIPTLNRKMTNALIENRNKSIKLLKHSSNGYQNWERFRSRCLYCLNSDTTYHLNTQNKKGGKKG